MTFKKKQKSLVEQVAFRHRTVPRGTARDYARGTARHRAVNSMQIYANSGFNVCMHLVKNGG
jgi:hypothetical protein